MGSKQANAVDVHVGLRIRAARLAAGLSQERLGQELGVTFQQVQKYEKGRNRVGACGFLTHFSAVSGNSTYASAPAGTTRQASEPRAMRVASKKQRRHLAAAR